MHSEVNVLEWHDWHLHCTCCSMYCAFVTALGCWFSDSLIYQALGSTEDSRCGCLWELVDTKKRNSHILTVVSRNLDSKTSKVWDCFLETARRGDYKKNLLRLALVLLAIYSSRGFIPYAGKNSAIAFYFFFPIKKNLLGGYSELRSIFGINLQLQTQNVHRAKFKRYISFHVVVLEHAPFLSCYTRKSRGTRLLAATCWV